MAKAAVRRAMRTDSLADESHFGVSLRRCALCGQRFLHVFCERVDWSDGDDPQAWVDIPISETEFSTLQAFSASAAGTTPCRTLVESDLLKIIATPRRFLLDLAPKGAERTLAWETRTPYIPPHD